MRHICLVGFLAIAVGLQLHGRAPELAWPQFRGPQGAGILAEGKLPTEWSAKDNVAWSVEVKGRGWS